MMRQILPKTGILRSLRRASVTALKKTSSHGVVGAFFVASALLLSAFPVFAAASTVPPEAKAALQAMYAQRADLQKAFNADGSAVPAMKARGLASLEEWAQRYGAKEYPDTLGAYAPSVSVLQQVPMATPAVLIVRMAPLTPVRSTSAAFNFSRVTANSVIVIDDATRKVLLSRNADVQWPLASISKLMTAMVSLGHGLDLSGAGTILAEDEVGGARLRVNPGTTLGVRDIFDSMLIGSANNAANAVARMCGLPKGDFVAAMNRRASELGMTSTSFVDPAGINPENVSTAHDIAVLALNAFDVYDVRRATTTSKFTLEAASQTHIIKSTDGLLTDPNNGLQVLGGKTGFLYESRWNFVVKVKDARNHPLVVVVLGSGSQAQSFADAKLAAQWVWSNYRWTKPSR